MMGLNYIRDFDLLMDVKFIKVLHDSDLKHDLLEISIVIFVVTLIPRIVGAFGLSAYSYKLYFNGDG